jgi:hypothetical protein
VPLVRTADGRILAAYRGDNGYYPSLDRLANVETPGVDGADGDEPESEDASEDASGPDMGLHPVILVFEPDLFDNYGLANRRPRCSRSISCAPPRWIQAAAR